MIILPVSRYEWVMGKGLTSMKKTGKIENSRIPLPERVPIHLKVNFKPIPSVIITPYTQVLIKICQPAIYIHNIPNVVYLAPKIKGHIFKQIFNVSLL